MKEEFTKEELQKAHGENGSCGSCGWHTLFWEHDYSPTDVKGEYWDSCKNDELEEGEAESHRGCYIYPIKEVPHEINQEV